MINIDQVKDSNPEAIASGMIGYDGMQKLASKTGMANQPAVLDAKTGLNLSVPSVFSVVKYCFVFFVNFVVKNNL